MSDKAIRVSEGIYNDLQVVKENEGLYGLPRTIALLIKKYNRCKEVEENLKTMDKEEKSWFEKWFGEEDEGDEG